MKKIYLLVIMVLALLFMMSGCGTKEKNVDKKAQSEIEENVEIKEEKKSEEQVSSENKEAEQSTDSEKEDQDAAGIKAQKHEVGETWGSDTLSVTVKKASLSESAPGASVRASQKETHRLLVIEFTIANKGKEPCFTSAKPFQSLFKTLDKNHNNIFYSNFDIKETGFDKQLEPGETRDFKLFYAVPKESKSSDFYFMMYPHPYANTIPSIGDVLANPEWHYVEFK